MAPTHMMLMALMMMTIMSQGRRDHHPYHMTTRMLTFPLQMFVQTPWKSMENLAGGPILRVAKTVLRRPVGAIPVGVHVEGEFGTISRGVPQDEDIVTTPSYPNERSTRILISRFRRPRGWSNVRQGMDKLEMRLHLIPLFNRLRMLGFLPRQTTSRTTNNLSSNHTSIPDSHLFLDLTSHQGPWFHGLLRMRLTTRFRHGQCTVAQALKVKGIHIDRCSPASAEYRNGFIGSISLAAPSRLTNIIGTFTREILCNSFSLEACKRG